MLTQTSNMNSSPLSPNPPHLLPPRDPKSSFKKKNKNSLQKPPNFAQKTSNVCRAQSVNPQDFSTLFHKSSCSYLCLTGFQINPNPKNRSKLFWSKKKNFPKIFKKGQKAAKQVFK